LGGIACSNLYHLTLSTSNTTISVWITILFSKKVGTKILKIQKKSGVIESWSFSLVGRLRFIEWDCTPHKSECPNRRNRNSQAAGPSSESCMAHHCHAAKLTVVVTIQKTTTVQNQKIPSSIDSSSPLRRQDTANTQIQISFIFNLDKTQARLRFSTTAKIQAKEKRRRVRKQQEPNERKKNHWRTNFLSIYLIFLGR
jgi:hypothetical protein